MADIQLDIMTYSSGSTLALCEQQYRWRYESRLRAKREEAEALVLGGWFHVGRDAFNREGLDAGFAAIDKARDSVPVIGDEMGHKIDQRWGQARAMLEASIIKWPKQDANLSERLVSMPIRNPDGGTSRSFEYRGIADGIEGDKLIDYKTIGDKDEFIESRTIGYQTEVYCLALQAEGIDITQAEFRLITKPTIKLCGKDKSPADYVKRCLEWILSDGNRTFTWEVHLNAGRMEEARWWLWNNTKRVLENRRSGRWMRNEHACHHWNRSCDFLPLCQHLAAGDDPLWLIEQDYMVIDNPHVELARLEGT